jgi:hypothetical protein
MADFRPASVLEASPEVNRSDEGGHQYIYALVAAGPRNAIGVPGIGGYPLKLIIEGPVAAVVSDMSANRIRPERRNLGAHQNVLKTLMDLSTIPLPMSFGIVGENPESIRRMLARNQAAILDQLRRVAGKVELGLRVKWEVPNIFEYFVDTHDELRSMRDRIVDSGRVATHDEKIEMGSLFDRTRNQDRTRFTEEVRRVLSPVCAELKVNKCKDEYEVMNLACLVPAERQNDFSGAVFGAARLFDDRYSFDFSGPWAPHNFVSLDLDLGDALCF